MLASGSVIELRRQGKAWIPIAGVLAGAGWGSNQFTPMLLVYHARLDLSTATLEALFGAYAAGLIPGLLLAGWWSDAHGRRPVGIGAAVLSLLASVSLIAGSHAVALLFAGRLLAGLGSGAAFGAGTVWLRETSLPPFGDADHSTVARRAAAAMTIGFALGPLVAGVLAQWLPAPTAVPYVPHIVLMMMVVLASFRAVPETLQASSRHGTTTALPPESMRRFRRLVVPMAPWVFAAPAIAFALLPSIVGAGQAADGVALTAAVTSLTALAGVLIQPVARRLEHGARDQAASMLGLLVLAVGLALEVQRLAPERALGVLTAGYYAVTYTGFAASYLMTLASGVTSYAVLLLIASGLAVLTAGVVRHGAQPQRERRAQAVRGLIG